MDGRGDIVAALTVQYCSDRFALHRHSKYERRTARSAGWGFVALIDLSSS